MTDRDTLAEVKKKTGATIDAIAADLEAFMAAALA